MEKKEERNKEFIDHPTTLKNLQGLLNCYFPNRIEEKREKLLKLTYDYAKTVVFALLGFGLTLTISTIYLFVEEHLLWALLTGITGTLALIGAVTAFCFMIKDMKKLVKMYAPKEDSQSEQKKRGEMD